MYMHRGLTGSALRILVIFLAALLMAGLSSCGKEKDTTPPVITLLGSNPMTVELGTSYVEPGFLAEDETDGDISAEVVVTGAVNTLAEGDYFLNYNVSDAAGNKAPEQVRKVRVLIF